MAKPTKFQQQAAEKAVRNYRAGGGDTTDLRRSKNPLFDPVTVYPGKSTVGGRNIGLQTTPMEKLSNANEITKKEAYLMSRALRGVLLFTGIEIATLVAWLIFAGVPFNVSTKSVIAVVILAVGLLAEHYVSVNVGAGRPPFGSLPPD